MITTCKHCGKMFATERYEGIAATPNRLCNCQWPEALPNGPTLTPQGQPSEETGLLPCPFCGSSPASVSRNSDEIVACGNVHCIASVEDGGVTRNDWNRRALPVSLDGKGQTASVLQAKAESPSVPAAPPWIREDTERLDWLANHVEWYRHFTGEIMRRLPTLVPSQESRLLLRAAIDAARSPIPALPAQK